jgi:HK97 family phage major capsid protein
MADLKKYFDAVNAAAAKLDNITADIDTLFEKGQNDEALALKPSLDAARTELSNAQALYLSMQGSTAGIDAARRFVPISAEDTKIGMTKGETQRYSLLRAIRAAADSASNPRAWDAAAFELEASRAVADKLGRPAKGFYVPYDVQASPINTQQAGDPSTGGYLKARELSSDSFIDILRGKMVLREAGATLLTGLIGDVDIPKKTTGATAYWIGEGSSPSKSTLGFGQVAGRARTVAAYSQLTRRFLRQSSLDAEGMVREDIAATIALESDRVGLHGTGAANEPLGLQHLTGIGSVVGGTDGAAPDWADIVNLETEVATDNADTGRLAYVTNQKVRGKLKQTTKANNQNGFVWENNEMNGSPAYATTQVSSSLTKGSSSGVCSAIFYGNWADLVFLYWCGLDVLVDPYTASTSGDVLITAMMDMDIVFRRAQSFAAMLDALTA